MTIALSTICNEKPNKGLIGLSKIEPFVLLIRFVRLSAIVIILNVIVWVFRHTFWSRHLRLHNLSGFEGERSIVLQGGTKDELISLFASLIFLLPILFNTIQRKITVVDDFFLC